jgi:alanine racemase
VQVRDLAAGDSVGYGASFVADRPMRIAALNLGYADGYLRAFSGGRGRALAGDAACPVLGRVSMDLTMVDVTAADIAEGDWLEVDYDLAAASAATGLSQYELLTGLGRRYLRRHL